MRLHLVKCTSSPLLLTTATGAKCPPPHHPQAMLRWAGTHSLSLFWGRTAPACLLRRETVAPQVYFIWGKKCRPAFQNVCVGLPSHLRRAGRLVPYFCQHLALSYFLRLLRREINVTSICVSLVTWVCHILTGNPPAGFLSYLPLICFLVTWAVFPGFSVSIML